MPEPEAAADVAAMRERMKPYSDWGGLIAECLDALQRTETALAASNARAERLAAENVRPLTPGYEHRQQAEAMEQQLVCTCGVPFAGDCPRHSADYVEGWIAGWDAARAALAGDAPVKPKGAVG